MMKTSGLLAAVAGLAAVCDARVRVHVPRATIAAILPLDGMSPMPTAPPVFHELRRRQLDSSTDDTVLVAPDNTCGYISGRIGAAYTCNNGAQCVFLTASSTVSGAVACCNEELCGFRVACVDYNQYFSSSVCDGGCQVDALTLKCTSTEAAFCNTISFSSGIIDYWCNSQAISTPQKATTTYPGQTDDREFTPLVLTDASSTAALSFESTGTSDTGPTVTSDPTDKAGGSDSDGDSDNNDNDSGKDKKGSSTPIGPIVGGVVGGVALIALIGLGIFFFMRNKKKKAAAAAAAAAAASPPVQQQPPGGYNAAYYDPKYAQATSPTNSQGYGQPPAAFYSVSSQHTGSPDPHNPVSPTGTHMTDPRLSQVAGSPTPSYATVPPPGQQQTGFQPQGEVIHEAPAVPSDHHRGTMHELA